VGSFRFLVSMWGTQMRRQPKATAGTESDQELESEGCASSQREGDD
jgi:hypothetical protein